MLWDKKGKIIYFHVKKWYIAHNLKHFMKWTKTKTCKDHFETE